MKLVDLEIQSFVDTLASNSPAPGGGSASALAGWIGEALLLMVTELTIGKKKYKQYEAEVKSIKEEALILKEELMSAVDADTEAFNKVSAVFTMPKETDEEKKLRRDAMQDALKIATLTPFNLMEKLVASIELTQQAVGKINPNTASDLGVAVLMMKAGLHGAWLNVLINLSSIKDKDFVLTYKSKGQNLLDRGTRLADQIYGEVATSL